MKKTFFLLLALVFLSACSGGSIFDPSFVGPSGQLDSSFGQDGKVITPLGQHARAYALVLQPNGKLIAAGASYDGRQNDFALARYNPDGSLDNTFGNGGTAVAPVTSVHEMAFALIIQPDGKVVAAGNSSRNFALARYNPDGSLDNTFDEDGMLSLSVGKSDSGIRALVRQPDGKLVAAGWGVELLSPDFALVRFNPDGSLDTRFGEGGVAFAEFSSVLAPMDIANSLVRQPDGKLVAAGRSEANFALARFHPDGSLDYSFGKKGLVVTPLITDYSNDEIKALVLQPDGKLLAAGATDALTNEDTDGVPDADIALVRYNSNGSLDTSFGKGGVVIEEVSSYADDVEALLLQPDGKLVVAGYSFGAANQGNILLLRYNQDGRLDTSFGSGGKVLVPMSHQDTSATAVVLQPDGKLVVAGYAHVNGQYNFVLLRFR
ncbi:delta-60 repeat domain-containing protein [Meiothermus hypogaeus]|uniref:Lipoprotein n=2 Tax=Meiothermus hypogaeus TaxID=884155 RepID=A0A511R157_9DEIN|nr:delta-60 repeat domain-containing protein [Meiothermus hypogaeus]RIH76784.1 delta-60 repeat domain protein [Meiothermus hypogaeus]GEM82756.1 hypothetical protein MHY01S_09220 [Meiothermus hypogaeus NBRC 106114]